MQIDQLEKSKSVNAKIALAVINSHPSVMEEFDKLGPEYGLFEAVYVSVAKSIGYVNVP